jgi:hypothetical protein
VTGIYDNLTGLAYLTPSTATAQNKEHIFARRGLTPLPEPHITGMKLLEDVSLGSLVLNRLDSDGIVWVVTDIGGWWTIPEPDYPDNDKAFGDGEYDVTGRFLGRQLSLSGSILCPDPSLVPKARDRLVSAINLVYSDAWLKATERQQGTTAVATINNVARSSNYSTYTTSANHGLSVGEVVTVSGATSGFNATMVVVEKTDTTFSCINSGDNAASAPSAGLVYLGEIVKAARVRLVDSPDIETVTARGRINFEFSLRAVDPIKYYFPADNSNFQRTTLPVDPNSSGLSKVANAGNYPVGAIITVTGPVESPLIIRNNTTDQDLTIISPLAGNETFNITREAIFDNTATLTLNRAHGLSVGKTITIENLSRYTSIPQRVITDIPDSDLGINARKISFAFPFGTERKVSSYTVGSQVNLSSVSVSSNVVTITTSANHIFDVGQEVYIGATGVTTYNGIQEITATTSNTFQFKMTAANLGTTSIGGFARVPGLITITTSNNHPFLSGETLTVRGVNPIANTPNAEILATPSADTLRYYNSTTRQIATAAYYATPSDSGLDTYTLTTVGPHGYRVGDSIVVEGVSDFFDTTLANITAVDTVDYTVSYEKASQVKFINTITYTKIRGTGVNAGKYRVNVTTTAAHGYTGGRVVNLDVTTTRGRKKPELLQGSKSIVVTNSTSFYFFVQPAKETPEYLREKLGAFNLTDTTITVSIINSGAGRSTVNIPDYVEGVPAGTVTAIPPTYTYPEKTVRLATTAAITLSGAQSIDGVAVANGDRILVKNQGNAALNGIYVANTSGAWTRATDFDAATANEIETGAAIYVTEGSTLAKTGWAVTTTGTITVGTTSITFSQVSPRGSAVVGLLENQEVAVTTPRAIVSVTADVLEIDTAKRSVLLNGEVEYARAKVDAVTDWLKIQPGTNEFYVNDENDQDNPRSTVQLSFRSGWIA